MKSIKATQAVMLEQKVVLIAAHFYVRRYTCPLAAELSAVTGAFNPVISTVDGDEEAETDVEPSDCACFLEQQQCTALSTPGESQKTAPREILLYHKNRL